MTKEAKMKFDDEMDYLIQAALADGKISRGEKAVLVKKALSMGWDKDEFLIVLAAKEREAQQAGSRSGSKLVKEEAVKWGRELRDRIEQSTEPIPYQSLLQEGLRHGIRHSMDNLMVHNGLSDIKKEEILKNAHPQNPYEYNEYLILLRQYDIDDGYINGIAVEYKSRFGHHPAARRVMARIKAKRIRGRVQNVVLILSRWLSIGAVLAFWVFVPGRWFMKLLATIFVGIPLIRWVFIYTEIEKEEDL